MTANFCTCTDQACPHHPVNTGGNCTPCIAKNLKQGEIPGCFFRKIHPDVSALTEFTMESFARFVEQHRGVTSEQ